MTSPEYPGSGGLFDALRVGVLVLCRDERVVLRNEWLRTASPRAIEIGARFEDVFPALVGTRLHRSVGVVISRGQSIVLSHALNRTPFPLERAGTAVEQQILLVPIVSDEGERQCLIQIFDVTASVKRERVLREKTTRARRAEADLVAAYAKLERVASSDGLTGVWNRRHFDETYSREWLRLSREGAPLSLVMLDIDHFKRFNDDHGHQVGDRCLRYVAKALAGALKRPADMLARYGGEEFVALLPNTPLAGALHVAEQLRRSVGESPPADLPAVTVSLGVACTSSTVSSLDALLGEADDALYEAKHAGRDRVCWRGDLEPALLSA